MTIIHLELEWQPPLEGLTDGQCELVEVVLEASRRDIRELEEEDSPVSGVIDMSRLGRRLLEMVPDQRWRVLGEVAGRANRRRLQNRLRVLSRAASGSQIFKYHPRQITVHWPEIAERIQLRSEARAAAVEIADRAQRAFVPSETSDRGFYGADLSGRGVGPWVRVSPIDVDYHVGLEHHYTVTISLQVRAPEELDVLRDVVLEKLMGFYIPSKEP